MKTTKFIAREKCIKNRNSTYRNEVIIGKPKVSVHNSRSSTNVHKNEDIVEKQKRKERYIVV